VRDDIQTSANHPNDPNAHSAGPGISSSPDPHRDDEQVGANHPE
jgi:hypothetical protein